MNPRATRGTPQNTDHGVVIDYVYRQFIHKLDGGESLNDGLLHISNSFEIQTATITLLYNSPARIR
jgi:hypothetical protein